MRRPILVAVPGSSIPELDDELRVRLGRRFGSAIDGWFAELPDVLEELADRWGVERGTPIQRGSMAFVIRCQTGDGRAAVLKVSPDRAWLAHEAAALARWRTPHVPAVLCVDESVGALMIEAIEPRTPLVDTEGYPDMESVASLLRLAAAFGADPGRLLDWCAAFAGMVAWEIAERRGGSREQGEPHPCARCARLADAILGSSGVRKCDLDSTNLSIVLRRAVA
jgi:hypothetical protein